MQFLNLLISPRTRCYHLCLSGSRYALPGFLAHIVALAGQSNSLELLRELMSQPIHMKLLSQCCKVTVHWLGDLTRGWVVDDRCTRVSAKVHFFTSDIALIYKVVLHFPRQHGSFMQIGCLIHAYLGVAESYLVPSRKPSIFCSSFALANRR